MDNYHITLRGQERLQLTVTSKVFKRLLNLLVYALIYSHEMNQTRTEI